MRYNDDGDDGRTDTQPGDLSANRFGLEGDDLESLLDEPGTDDIADLLDDATEPADLDTLLEAGTDDLESLLDDVTAAADAEELLDDMADHWAEEVARQWDTPPGEWWP